jgi:YfiH family protein
MELRETPVSGSAVPRLELVEWAKRHGLVAGITGRTAEFSWTTFRAGFEDRFPSSVRSKQVHGIEVRWQARADEGWRLLDGFDGHATDQAGVLLTVSVADCIPVYLAVPRCGVVALLHAGWRGTAAGILARGVRLLREQTGASSSEIVIHCGVGICGACYEVGSEVAERLTGTVPPGPVHVDLRSILAAQAASLGLLDVSISPWCTAHDRERFFSYRASGGGDGRQAAYLGRPCA